MTRRSKDKPAEPGEPTPPERPAHYRQTMHLSLDATDLANLDKIAEDMRRHPTIGRLHSNIGREKAARHAIASWAEMLTASSTATG